MTTKIEVPKEELDNLLSDLYGYLKNENNSQDEFWWKWLNLKKYEIEAFRKKYILGEHENEIWCIFEKNYFRATDYERDYNASERFCKEFGFFTSEEKVIEAFNEFRHNHRVEKRFREGVRWFSFRNLGITHYEVRKISEYDYKYLTEPEFLGF